MRVGLGLLAIVSVAPAAPAQEKAMHHATGTFTVTMTPETQTAGVGDGLPTSRVGIAKTFTGGIAGTSTATMLAAGSPAAGKAAAYVAIEQVSAAVDGRQGGFLLLHRGTIAKGGASDLSVVVAPDSGTGALAGIAGTLTIEITGGVHHYDLAYTLPPVR